MRTATSFEIVMLLIRNTIIKIHPSVYRHANVQGVPFRAFRIETRKTEAQRIACIRGFFALNGSEREIC